MLSEPSKGLLGNLREGIHLLASNNAVTRIPRLDVTRICRHDGQLSIHGLKLDLSAGNACPKSLLHSLTSDEHKEASRLEKTGRAKQYCIGRALAKRSVVDVYAGAGVKTGDVSIVDDERGAPQCIVETTHELPAVSVSLTHKGNLLLAVASLSERVGIDLEDLSEAQGGAARWTTVDPDGHLKNAVRSTVEKLSGYTDPGQIATVMWCVKEAAYKALSRGRRLSPLQVVLEPAEDHLVARAGTDKSLVVNVTIGCSDQLVCALAL